MIRLKFVILISLFCCLLMANELENFENFMREEKFEEALNSLNNWANDNQDDPRLYFCYFNYYLTISQGDGAGIQFDSTENTFYFGPNQYIDLDKLQLGIDIIKEGIEKYPNNFNMRFGLLYMYLLSNKLDDYIREFELILSYFSNMDLSKFEWYYDEEVENPAEFLIENIQSNYYSINHDFDYASKDSLFTNKYCDLMIKYFPENKYGYSNKGIIAHMNHNNELAIELLKQALEIENTDLRTIFNIAFIYKLMEDYDNSRKYFKKVIEVGGDPYFVEGAKDQIEELKNY